jgi:hypothetical protein
MARGRQLTERQRELRVELVNVLNGYVSTGYTNPDDIVEANKQVQRVAKYLGLVTSDEAPVVEVVAA